MYNAAIKSTETSWIRVVHNVQILKTIRSEYPYCATLRDIHFLLFYSIWTLRTTLIQLVSVLFIAALYTVPTLI